MNALVFYASTDIGVTRNTNQDNFRVKVLSDDMTIAVVCDGMGGVQGGAVASSLAVSSFIDVIKDADDIYGDDVPDSKFTSLLLKAARISNLTVYEASISSEDLIGMGTTLVAALMTKNRIYAVNVGDSRMYVYSDKELSQITRDHSYVQYLVDIGRLTPQKAKRSDRKNIITKAIGTHRNVEPDTFTVNIEDKSSPMVLLCSDGLTNMVEPNEIEDILKNIKDPENDIKTAADDLVALANSRGGKDNITVAVVSY